MILGYSAYQLFSKVVYPVLIVIIDESSSVSSPKKEQDPTIPLPVTESKAKRNDDDVLVYRWAKHRNTRAREYQNLTPRPWSDDDGLSFSLVPTTTKENATTTLGALRDAGFICTVKGNHVSVMPAGGMAALDSWKRSYDTANSNPHELTLLLYGITW